MLQKIQMRAGVNRDGTNYSNEGGFYECEKIRFRSGFPEKLGGWARVSANTFYGVVRSLQNWITLSGINLIAVGTNQKYYVSSGGAYNDITPLDNTVTLAANPIATVSGSKIVTITHAAHSKTIGTFVTFSGATAVGGLTIVGEYEIVDTPLTSTYVILAASNAASTASGGGAGVSAVYQLLAGLPSYTLGLGWGAGGWGRAGWGDAATSGVGQQLTLWSQDNFGQDLVLAQRGGGIYYWAANTTSYPRAVTLNAAATTAGYSGGYVPNTTNQILTSEQRFTIAIGANGYVAGNTSTTFDPMLVRWSDQENVYDWVPATTNQAGELKLAHGSSLVQALVTRQEVLIWSDSAIYSMQYIGAPYFWGIQVLTDNISIMSPNAAVSVNNVTYWMGGDKFYSYSGRVDTLGCTLWQYVFGDLNKEQAWQVVCGTNEGYSEVWWHYPSGSSPVNDRYVIFNYQEKVWYYGQLNRTAWQDSPLQTYPLAAFSIQVSYTNAAINSAVTTVTVVGGDSYPISGTLVLDSEQITYTGRSGNSLTGCTRGVNSTTAASHTQYTRAVYSIANTLVYHEASVDDEITGSPVAISSYIESSDFDIGDGHNYGFVWRMIPDVNFNGSSAASPVVTMTLKPRVAPGAPYGTAATPTVTRTSTVPVSQYTEQVYVRVRGRQMSLKISSDALGVAWQLGTPRVDVRQDGRRS